MEYYVNEPRRTVVAILPNAQKEAFYTLKMIFKNRCINKTYNDIFSKNTLYSFINKYMPDIVRGKAKCSPEDVWNQTVGENLAEMRALARFYKYCETILIKYMEYIQHNILEPFSYTWDYVSGRIDFYNWVIRVTTRPKGN